MPPSPSRQIAYQTLLQVDSGLGFAADLLQGAEVFALKEADRRLATEIVMGVLRWQGELDYQIEHISGKKIKVLDREVLTILRMGVYQIRFLERIPKRAAVDEAVELTKAARKRSAAGFVNAVLRKCDPPKDRLSGRKFEQLSPENWESVRRAFPAWLLRRWEESIATTHEPGELGALQLAYASLATPPTTLRVVDAHANLDAIREELQAEGVATSPRLYATARGLRVDSGHIQNNRAYGEGRIVIQDEASQLVAELVAPEAGQRVLDLCAAPGMKAGQVAQALGSGTLVACDHSLARLRAMTKLLPPWIPASVRLSMLRLDAARQLPFSVKFDRILLDAPCSGTGTLARNPEIKWRLSPADIMRLAELQGAMLRHALPLIADGGSLIYATCSLEPEENDGVVKRVLREEPAFRLLSQHELALRHPHLTPLFDSCGYFVTRPDRHPMDGFHAAVIVRK